MTGPMTSPQTQFDDFRVMPAREVRGGERGGLEFVMRPLAEPHRRRHQPITEGFPAMYDTTRPESMPPLRNAPSGTSLSRRA